MNRPRCSRRVKATDRRRKKIRVFCRANKIETQEGFWRRPSITDPSKLITSNTVLVTYKDYQP